MKEKINEFWYWNKELIISITVIGIICFAVFYAIYKHDQKWKCLSGHTETQYYYDMNLKMTLPNEVWVCDYEILRSEYDSLVNIGKTPY